VACLLERLSNCDSVVAVSMDMSTTFREAIQLCLPHTRIAADHFHVIQHVGKAPNKPLGRYAKKEEGLPFLRLARRGSSKKPCARGMRTLKIRRRQLAWMCGSLPSNATDPENCAKLCLLSAIGDRKSWPSLTFCPHASPMALWKARTITPKP
jgi:Transposase